MKTILLVAGAILALTMIQRPLAAQASGGNSGPGTGGTTGVSGTAGSGSGTSEGSMTRGQNTAGSSQALGTATNAPTSGEFHPPITDPGEGTNQH